MDFFHSKPESVITPSTLNYFAIYDPSLSVSEDDTIEQLLLFITNDEITTNEKLRKIGLVEGIRKFSQDYNKDTDEEELDWIELDNCQVLSIKFEERYNFILSVSLLKIENEEIGIEYQDSSFSSFIKEVIKQGYDEFRIHNGTITSLFESMNKEEFIEFLNKWWNIWFKNFQINVSEDGVLKMFKGIKKSGIKIDSEIIDNLKSLQQEIEFKEMLIYNNNHENYEEIGLVYEYFKNLEYDSKYRLLNWLKTVDYYGMDTMNLLSSNIIKFKQEIEDDGVNEFVYDPFKLVYNTITDVSKITGITQGVNNVTSTFNSYIPWFKKNEAKEEEDHKDDENNLVEDDLEFLVGLNGEFITYKNLYLKFKDDEDESLKRIIIFKYFKFNFILIYDFKNNSINDLTYYKNLYKSLKKIGKLHLSNKNITLTKRNFYFIGYNKETRIIESNIPNIPKEEKSSEDEISRYQIILIHKQLIKENFNNLTDNKEFNNFEKLTRGNKNGWWIYNLNKDGKQLFIIKRWNQELNSKILENSTNVLDIIGKEGKQWLDNYIE